MSLCVQRLLDLVAFSIPNGDRVAGAMYFSFWGRGPIRCDGFVKDMWRFILACFRGRRHFLVWCSIS